MRPTPADIIKAVSMRFELNSTQIVGRNAIRTYSRPRQIAMFLAREMTSMSYPQIGRHFRRDHTTVLWAVRGITKLLDTDREALEAVETCRQLAKVIAGGRAERRQELLQRPLYEVRGAA
jgi:chromosomal replication initiator protein